MRCPECGKNCYIDEKNNDFACSDENCLMSIGYNKYLDRIFSEEITGINCEVTKFHHCKISQIKKNK
jgi:hypothetical protein